MLVAELLDQWDRPLPGYLGRLAVVASAEPGVSPKVVQAHKRRLLARWSELGLEARTVDVPSHKVAVLSRRSSPFSKKKKARQSRKEVPRWQPFF